MSRIKSAVAAILAIVLVWPTIALATISTSTALDGGGGVSGEGIASSLADNGTGSAQTSVAFELPEGRGGLSPSLSISYDSSSGDGEAGLGWALSLPSIRRVRNPRAFELAPSSNTSSGAYTFPSPSDRYEWAGSPLVEVCQVVTEGCAGNEPFSTDKLGLRYFRLKVDGTYTRFFLKEYSGLPGTWIVEHKSGLTEVYGGENASDVVVSGANRVSVRYRLSRRVDTHPGNVIHYLWTENPLDKSGNVVAGHRGLKYLSDIYYTPSVAATTAGVGIGSYSAAANYETHVRLSWEAPDFRQQFFAPVWLATPDLRLTAVDVATNPSTSATASAPRQMLRRYHLRYLESNTAGKPGAPGGPLLEYRHGVDGPLRGHSFLKSVQLEGRCEVPAEETESNEHQFVLPESTECPKMPPTWFEYSPRTSMPVLPRESTVRPLVDVTDGQGRVNIAFTHPEQVSLVDIDRDGRPDLLEGWWNAQRNRGTAGILDPRFVGDCLETPGLTHPLPSPPDWLTFLHERNGLTLPNFFGFRGEGATFLWRNNEFLYGGNRTIPGHNWAAANLGPKVSPCNAPLPADVPRKTWTFVRDDSGISGAGGMPPVPAAGDRDRLLIVGDVDGDGLPDAYVRRYDSTNGADVIRFTRRNLSAARGVSPFAERVVSTLNVSRFVCGPTGKNCAGYTFNEDGQSTGQAPPPNSPDFELAHRALVDMNGDGVADYLASSFYRAPPPDENGSGFIRDVRYGYIPGRGTGRFGCEESQLTPGPVPSCSLDLSLARVVGPGATNAETSAIPVAPNTPFGLFPTWKGLPTPNAEGVWANAHRPVFFSDVNADGYTDVIVARQHEHANGGEWVPDNGISFAIFINEAGFGFHRYCADDPSGATCTDADDPQVLEFEQPALGLGQVKVLFGDIRSRGVNDIIVVTPNKVLSLGFGPVDVKPGLLTKVHNGLGATTEFEYETFQQHSVGFENAESETLEVVRYVVKRSTTSNGLTGTGQGRTVTTNYTYRGPAFDPWERKFLGFKRVVASRADGPSVVTDYRVGRCFERNGCASTSDGANDPPRVVTTLTKYAANPLRADGTIGDTPAISQVQFHNAVVRLASGTDPRPHIGVYVRERRTLLFDPANLAHTTLMVPVLTGEGFEDHALNVTESIPVQVPQTPDFMLRTTQHLDENGNADHAEDHGRVKMDLSPIDVVNTTQSTFERKVVANVLPGLPPTAHDWTWRTKTVTLSAPGDTPRQTSVEYWPNGDLKSTSAYLADQLGLDRYNTFSPGDVAPNPPGVRPDGWYVRGSFFYDDFGNLTKVLGGEFDAIGGARRSCTTYGYDWDFGHFRQGTKVFVNGCDLSGAPGSQHTYVGENWDRGFAVPVARLNAGTLQTVELDAFGRATKSFDPDPVVPYATETVPRVRVAYYDTAPVSRIERFTRDPQGPVVQTRKSIDYADAQGMPLLSLHEHEDGGWVATGLVERTPIGLPQFSYLPYRFVGDTTDPSFSVPVGTKYVSTLYDPYDRPVGTFDGGGPVQLSKVEYHPLSVTTYDANDLDPSSSHFGTPSTTYLDGHGRLRISRGLRHRSDGTLEASFARYEYNVAGQAIIEERGTEDGLHSRIRSRSFDTLGRVAQQIEPNATTALHQIRYVYNGADLLVGTSDARGCGENLHYDGSGRLVATDRSPCLKEHGEYTPPDLVSGDGTESFNWFDNPEPGVPGAAYGDGGLYPGNLLASYELGAHTRYSYDLRGRSKKVSRRIAKPGRPDKVLSQRYTTHWFQTESTYDSNDRVIGATTGADVPELTGSDGLGRMTFGYGARGEVTSIGSSYGNILTGTEYRADGLPSRMQFGDAAQTAVTYAYDESGAEARLHEVKIERGASPTWALPPYPAVGEPVQQPLLGKTVLSHDRAGNITSIAEDLPSSDADWPSGAKPRTRTILYDDFYRVRHVSSVYAGAPNGKDAQVSVYAHEGGASRGVPRSQVATRRTAEAFEYDYLGNITRSQDDEQVRFDRSLGIQHHDPAKPEQLVSADGVSVHYDDSGNMVDVTITRPGPCEHGQPCNQRFLYDWDEVGQLVRARRWDYVAIVPGVTPQYPDVPTDVPQWDLSYAYAGGARVLKSAKEAGEARTYTLEVFDTLRVNRTSYVADDYVRDASHETVYLAGGARVVYGSDDLPLASAGRARLFLSIGDHLGSTSLVIDHATGELVEKISYGAFGEVEADYRPARWEHFREDLRFTGKEEDEEVGLTYFGARYLNSRLERWISPDPLTIHAWGADPNPYAYVGGNVINAIDPFGLSEHHAVEDVTVHGGRDRRDRWANEEGHLEQARLPDQNALTIQRAPLTAGGLAGGVRGATAGIVAKVRHTATKVGQAAYETHLKQIGIIVSIAYEALRASGAQAKKGGPALPAPVVAARDRAKAAVKPILPAPQTPAGTATKVVGQVLGKMGEAYFAGGLDKGVDAAQEAAGEEGLNGVALREGQKAIAGFHGHHIFPVAFKETFEALDINIDEFRTQVQEGLHGQLHKVLGGMGPGGYWNETWRQYFLREAAAGRALTREGVLMQGAKMLDDVQLPYYSPIPQR